MGILGVHWMVLFKYGVWGVFSFGCFLSIDLAGTIYFCMQMQVTAYSDTTPLFCACSPYPVRYCHKYTDWLTRAYISIVLYVAIALHLSYRDLGHAPRNWPS
jgi:hypothetical protein